jgi:hypothetical protein
VPGIERTSKMKIFQDLIFEFLKKTSKVVENTLEKISSKTLSSQPRFQQLQNSSHVDVASLSSVQLMRPADGA